MNFPGLDPPGAGCITPRMALGLIRTWSLAETRAALRRGEKVLVVATTALGDSLLTTPLIETLSQHLGPRARFAAGQGALRRALPGRSAGAPRLFRARKISLEQICARELTADPHRIALLANMTEPDLMPLSLARAACADSSAIATRWTRYPGWMANGAMLRRPGEPDYATGHAIENNLAMAAALGLEPATHRLALPQFRNEEQIPARRPDPSRRLARDQAWPVENWARLADALADEFNVGMC